MWPCRRHGRLIRCEAAPPHRDPDRVADRYRLRKGPTQLLGCNGLRPGPMATEFDSGLPCGPMVVGLVRARSAVSVTPLAASSWPAWNSCLPPPALVSIRVGSAPPDKRAVRREHRCRLSQHPSARAALLGSNAMGSQGTGSGWPTRSCHPASPAPASCGRAPEGGCPYWSLRRERCGQTCSA
jgi:hypothetical protein